jgi:glyoxylase-like metal-dependent hydrolase (beta-lactamase superfamily II)
MPIRHIARRAAFAAVAAGLTLPAAAGAQARPALRLKQVSAGESAFHVVATLVAGPTESILFDAQYHVSDARRLADSIASTGTRLKAIILSHADHDHYMGAIEIVRRFPGTPVYMTAAGVEDFKARSARDWTMEKFRSMREAPDSLVAPQVLPSMHFTVDGNEVEVIPDLAGDVRKPSNSVLWIPSLRTVLAGDVVFNGVHPWLGDSDAASRTAWRESLTRIAGLKPATVVAGHKRDLDAADSPEILKFMDGYLADFESLMQAAATPAAVAQAMREKYPQLVLPGLMEFGARQSFRK